MNKVMRKNILDLEFQKNLVIASTSTILIFTYLVGLTIASITKQIIFSELFYSAIFIIFSLLFFRFCSYLLNKSLSKIREIPETIKNL